MLRPQPVRPPRCRPAGCAHAPRTCYSPCNAAVPGASHWPPPRPLSLRWWPFGRASALPRMRSCSNGMLHTWPHRHRGCVCVGGVASMHGPRRRQAIGVSPSSSSVVSESIDSCAAIRLWCACVRRLVRLHYAWRGVPAAGIRIMHGGGSAHSTPRGAKHKCGRDSGETMLTQVRDRVPTASRSSTSLPRGR